MLQLYIDGDKIKDQHGKAVAKCISEQMALDIQQAFREKLPITKISVLNNKLEAYETQNKVLREKLGKIRQMLNLNSDSDLVAMVEKFHKEGVFQGEKSD